MVLSQIRDGPVVADLSLVRRPIGLACNTSTKSAKSAQQTLRLSCPNGSSGSILLKNPVAQPLPFPSGDAFGSGHDGNYRSVSGNEPKPRACRCTQVTSGARGAGGITSLASFLRF